MAASCRSRSCLANEEKISVRAGIGREKHVIAAVAVREKASFKEDIESGVPANLRENGEIRTRGLAGSNALEADRLAEDWFQYDPVLGRVPKNTIASQGSYFSLATQNIGC
jgi:hypothetical protein